MQIPNAIESLEGIGTWECESFRNKILMRYPGITHHLAKAYLRVEKESGYVSANQWLLDIESQLKLGRTGLKLTGGPSLLADYCTAKATKTQRQIHQTVHAAGKEATPNIIRAVVERAGVTFPLGKTYGQEELLAALARVCDEKWWKRQLRPKQWRETEDFIRGLGAVSKRQEIYVSDVSLFRRLEQKRGNARLLAKMEAENQDGQVYTLAELAELSPSNPLIRRSELMMRARGFEEFSEQSPDEFQGMFYTLTCPSKFHATHRHGQPNPKFDGSTVAQGQQHLNTVWQRTRAAFDRADISPFGFRVAEPHHDGTPHWHLLLFIPKAQSEEATAIFRRYALEEDGDESGAEEHRLKTVPIDPSKGSATGYIAKYIAKNIDGHEVGEDHYGRDAIESAVRIEAWASIHKIRQFQQIGGASVTVWRELRRLETSDLDPGLMKGLVAAADDGDWEAYNTLMGGVICPRANRPLRPMMIERADANCYGEKIKVIKGIWYGDSAIATRPHVWTVRIIPGAAKSNTSEDGIGFGVGLSNAPPGACAPLDLCQ